MKFRKLLKESQFHGGRRLAEKNDCRLCWLVALVLLFGSAVAVICVTVRRFFDNPTYMVRLETVDNSIDFPSVIVCPEVFFLQYKIDKFLAQVRIPPALNYTYVRNITFQLGAFFSPDIKYRLQDLVNLEYLLKYNDIDLDTAGRMLTSSCEESLIRCRWQGAIRNCTDIFHMDLTGDGYCCVFNGKSLRRVSNSRAWRTETFGYDSGLMLVVNQSQAPINIDLTYKWLAVQSTRHYVESTINGSALNPGAEQWVEYHIRSFQIAEEARSLSHSLRKCRLAYEPLKIFPIYHKKYCLVECDIARTIKYCNCVRLVHPRPPGIDYCTAHQLICAMHVKVSFENDECDCLPACDVATDFVKVSTYALMNDVKPIDTFYDDLIFENVTIVRVFVHTNVVDTHSRMSLITNIDLFSQLGGVFNVFFGCSIFTIAELAFITYYGLRQLFAKLKKKSNLQSYYNIAKREKKNVYKKHQLKKN